MSTDSGEPIDAQPIRHDPPADSDRGTDPDNTDPTPGSDNDGAEAGYTPPSGSDDPVSD